MGIWEALKRAYAQITGKTDGMYRIHSNRVGHPADGDVFYDVTASSPIQCPDGVEWYLDTNGDLAWKWKRDTAGHQHVIPYTTSETITLATSVLNNAAASPYFSNGANYVRTSDVSGAPPAMLAKSISITAEADGSVASAQLLPSAGAGDKWTIYYLALSAGDLAIAGEAKQLTISDGIGVVSAGMCAHGPFIQNTAATAINYSAAAGFFGNAEVMSLNIQYRESA